MPGERVEILYEVITRGQEKIAQLSRQTAELEAQNKKLTATMNRNNEAQAKAETSSANLSKSLRQVRSVMLPLTLTLAALAGGYAILSKNSDNLQSLNEKVGRSVSKLANTLGDQLAVALKDSADGIVKMLDGLNKLASHPGISAGIQDFFKSGGNLFAFGAGMADKKRALKMAADAQAKSDQMASLRVEKMREDFAIGIARAEGNIQEALRLQIAQKRKLIDLDESLGSHKKEMLKLFDQQAAAEMQALKMAELSLKNYQQIGKDFKRDIVGAFRSGVSDPIFDLLQGKKMNLQDLIEPLRSGINRAISNAIGEMFVTKAFSKGSPFSGIGKMFGFGKDKMDPTAKAVEEASKKQDNKLNELIRTMEQVARCACNTAASSGITASGVGVLANNVGRMGGYSGISGITATLAGGGGGGILSKIGSIAGAVSTLGSFVSGSSSFLSSMGGGGGGLSGLGGGVGGGTGLPSGAGFSGGGFGSLPVESRHSGGWVKGRRFASGGEVPAFVQPGEFVVRRGAAQENKDALEAMHQGKPVKGTGGHVFLIKANDAQSFVQHLATPAARAQLEIQVIKAIMGNGTAREVIKNYAK